MASDMVNGKERYYSFNSYLRGLFRERVQRVPLDAGLGCPHRDRYFRGGCIYCDPLGSGTGYHLKPMGIRAQMEEGMSRARQRYRARLFIAYFQSYTNTYAPVGYLKALFEEATAFEDVVGLIVATRPDCLGAEVLDLLAEYGERMLVWLELGLQSSHDNTLRLINRGHTVADFEKGFFMARERGLKVCIHTIVGLPGETKEMILKTARYVASLKAEGIKIHNIYVVEGTVLWDMMKKGEFRPLDQDTYVELVVNILEELPPDTVIMRLTGDPPPHWQAGPDWAYKKMLTLRKIDLRLSELETYQGRRWRG